MKRANSADTTAVSRYGNHLALPTDGSNSKRLRRSSGYSSDEVAEIELDELFSENIVAKIWAVAVKALSCVSWKILI